jgi:hypothetical protein
MLISVIVIFQYLIAPLKSLTSQHPITAANPLFRHLIQLALYINRRFLHQSALAIKGLLESQSASKA